MEVWFMRQPSAIAASTAKSTALRFNTGRAPGRPRQTGQTLVLGGAPKRAEHEQKILVTVRSWTCTSSPITGSYLARDLTEVSGVVAISSDYKGWDAEPHPVRDLCYFCFSGALRYFSSGTSKYINSFPLASRTPVK